MIVEREERYVDIGRASLVWRGHFRVKCTIRQSYTNQNRLQPDSRRDFLALGNECIFL